MKGYTEVYINENVNEIDLENTYLYNNRHNHGGVFNYGNNNGFSIGNNWISAQTGDNLYDHITINGYKVYKKEPLEDLKR